MGTCGSATRLEQLDAILEDWHRWQQRYTPARGYPATAAGMGDFRISRQYDTENGALDIALDDRTMRIVDFQVSEMEDPYKAAIYVRARARALRCSVFGSPRMPADREQCAAVLATATDMITARLVSCGVI